MGLAVNKKNTHPCWMGMLLVAFDTILQWMQFGKGASVMMFLAIFHDNINNAITKQTVNFALHLLFECYDLLKTCVLFER